MASMSIPTFYCSDYPEIQCCDSCHVDHDDFGYTLAWYDYPNGMTAETCCRVHQWIIDNPTLAPVKDT